jgi:probable blue pigment (indigoidine) exporter
MRPSLMPAPVRSARQTLRCNRDPLVTPPAISPVSAGHLARLAPAITAACAFGCADVLTKLTFEAGAGALTMTVFRGLIGLPLLTGWLLVGARPKPLGARATAIALGIGVLFAGNVYWLFKALEIVDVPGATGLETLGWRGAATALVAFLGLALMVGAHPGGVAAAGIAFAIAAALCRVVILLITRASLVGADSRLVTFYSILSATAVFVLFALASGTWQPPMTALGWMAMVGSSIAMTVAVLMIFVSTVRVGPFRTAMFMNLEPLIATAGSAVVLGELITPLQGIGGAVMIAALVAFQGRR